MRGLGTLVTRKKSQSKIYDVVSGEMTAKAPVCPYGATRQVTSDTHRDILRYPDGDGFLVNPRGPQHWRWVPGVSSQLCLFFTVISTVTRRCEPPGLLPLGSHPAEMLGKKEPPGSVISCFHLSHRPADRHHQRPMKSSLITLINIHN